MGAKMTTASALVASALASATRRAPISVRSAPVSTSVANRPSEQRVDEWGHRGAFGEHDQHREQEHRDHDRPEPPLLADLHEGPQLPEDPRAALFRLRHCLLLLMSRGPIPTRPELC